MNNKTGGRVMFGLQGITSAGAALMRKAATDSAKIVFTRARAGSAWEYERGALFAHDYSWYAVKTGTVSAVSNGLGFLQAVAAFSAGDGTDPIKSVCICAQIAKDDAEPVYDEDDDVVFAAVTNDNAGFTDADAFQVQFDLPCVAGSIVDAVGNVPTAAGLAFVSFTPGNFSVDGVLQVKLADGTVIDIAANEHSD